MLIFVVNVKEKTPNRQSAEKRLFTALHAGKCHGSVQVEENGPRELLFGLRAAGKPLIYTQHYLRNNS